MDHKAQRPYILRILSSRVFWGVVLAILVFLVLTWGTSGFTGSVTSSQAQFVADSVRRSAVQCYAIEGRFPPTVGGIEHLEQEYGLAIDHTRYLVYYESLGDNLIPQIRVVLLAEDTPIDDIADILGLGTGVVNR